MLCSLEGPGASWPCLAPVHPSVHCRVHLLRRAATLQGKLLPGWVLQPHPFPMQVSSSSAPGLLCSGCGCVCPGQPCSHCLAHRGVRALCSVLSLAFEGLPQGLRCVCSQRAGPWLGQLWAWCGGTMLLRGAWRCHVWRCHCHTACATATKHKLLK